MLLQRRRRCGFALCLLFTCVQQYPVGYRGSLLTREGEGAPTRPGSSHPAPRPNTHLRPNTQTLTNTYVHKVVTPVLVTAQWRPSGIYKCVHPAAERDPHRQRSPVPPCLSCMHPPAGALVWRGRGQVVTPRWPQSGLRGSLFALFYCFSALPQNSGEIPVQTVLLKINNVKKIYI